MPTLTSTQKKAILMILVLVGTLAAYALFFLRIERLRDEVVARRMVAEEVHARAELENSMEALVIDTAAERGELMRYLLPVEDPTSFLGLLETIGADTGVVLEVESLSEEGAVSGGVQQRNAESAPSSPSVRVTLSVSGTWDGLYHMVTLLETMPYLASVESVTFEEEVAEGSALWRGQLQLRVLTGV